jgi:hypothetical protein
MIIEVLIFIQTWKKEGFETPSICRKFDLGFLHNVFHKSSTPYNEKLEKYMWKTRRGG